MKRTATVVLMLALSSALSFGADAKAGQAAYDKACKSCHGAKGEPNPAIAKMMKVEMKDLGSAEVQAMSDEQLKKAITDGVGKMKPVKSLSSDQASDVVAYIRTLKK